MEIFRMTDINGFIATYPGLVYLIISVLFGAVVYQYREGRKAEKSALLNEVGKVATAIENMAIEIARLFKKDQQKEDRISGVESDIKSIQMRCNEREKHCPGMNGFIHMRRDDGGG